jgi:hypothetical protein
VRVPIAEVGDEAALLLSLTMDKELSLKSKLPQSGSLNAEAEAAAMHSLKLPPGAR